MTLRVLEGQPLPQGWAGKLWALEQGLAVVERPYVLLLDADIELGARLVPALLAAARERDATLVSLLAELHCATFWERLLSPAFVFFFKLLYPFAWSNDARKATAAAAGGCMLVRTAALRDIGGFAAIRGALIDDCTLAAALKRARPPIWLGMSHSVHSLRVYGALGDFWSMVSRSAFTQLRYSTGWLLVATALMVVTLLAPVAGIVVAGIAARAAAGADRRRSVARDGRRVLAGRLLLSSAGGVGVDASRRRGAISRDDLELGARLLARHARELESARLRPIARDLRPLSVTVRLARPRHGAQATGMSPPRNRLETDFVTQASVTFEFQRLARTRPPHVDRSRAGFQGIPRVTGRQ